MHCTVQHAVTNHIVVTTINHIVITTLSIIITSIPSTHLIYNTYSTGRNG